MVDIGVCIARYRVAHHKEELSQRKATSLVMPTTSYISMAYPYYESFADTMRYLPLSSRSVLIKCCQAQCFPSSANSVLSNLIDKEPPVIITYSRNIPSGTYTLRSILQILDFDPNDPLESAICLDIIRFSEVEPVEVELAKEKGWWKEIDLAMGHFREENINWEVIFGEERSRYRYQSLHPDLPPNFNMANDIYNSLCRFRAQLVDSTIYSRASHKNMSWQTRREFESTTRSSLDGEGIFGQDDYLRFYHQSGILLEGATEMRQKWYHSGAKPRTYFAMGGSAYQHSRFVQDIFSKLVDSFPSFNHKTRLRPGRLSVPVEIDDEDVHWRIYDLSSFTSNCCVQRSFVLRLAHFLSGTSAFIVDERIGPVEVDIGDLMMEYYTFCVEEPSLSLERYDPDLRNVVFFHEVASMLGIFGNLMTCTFAHGTIVGMSTPDVHSSDSYNCAGDDGLVPERPSTSFFIDRGVRLVGSYEREKSFRGDEEAPICLKRPFVETFPQPALEINIIPPTLATCVALLNDSFSDPRYNSFTDETLTWIDKVNIIAKDLLRFLRSAFKQGYPDWVRLEGIINGFRRLVRKYVGWNPTPGVHIAGVRPLWPVGPDMYEFDSLHPVKAILLYFAPPIVRVEKREVMVDVSLQYERAGDEFRGNSTKRLKLLEMLGYVEKEEVFEDITDVDRLAFLEDLLLDDSSYDNCDPVVYHYTIVREIPYHFMYHI
jgi:hypothetical protein